MSDPIQSIARHLGIQTFGDGLLAKIGQTIDLLQEAARNRADLATECERLREQHEGAESQAEYQRDRAEHFQTERDAALAELAALKGGREAVAMIRYARGVPGFENEMPHVVSCNTMPDGLYPVYLAPPAQASAWVPDSWRRAVYEAEECLTGCCASPDIADKIDVETVGKIIAHLQETRFAMLAAAPTPGASDGKGGES